MHGNAGRESVRHARGGACFNQLFIERQNLTMRMGMRRFTRLTNAFSKKVENHEHAVALHYMHYNFLQDSPIAAGHTSAMEAGVSDHVWSLEEIISLLDLDQQAAA